jgi:hypothetical protein
LVLIVGILLLTLTVPAGAAAADDPWADDPLGLIAFRDEVSALYTTGQDVWEVWVCEVADGSVPVDLSATVTLLNAEIGQYFFTLSGGIYQPTFRAGGVVASPVSEPGQDMATRFLDGCEDQVAATSVGGVAGALIVATTDYTGGFGTIGYVCPGYYPGYPYMCPKTYPENGRIVVVGGGTVVTVPPLLQPRLKAVAHEIGHAIGWPHSFGGLTFDEVGRFSEYDNPMDLMSGSRWTTLEGYTLAANRYAAGWVAPASVVFHRKGSFEYRVGAQGTSAPQMLVLPSDAGSSLYQFIGARVPEGYDATLPAQGVEVYEINQSPWICERYAWEEPDWPCYGYERRTSQLPAVSGYDGTSHVHSVGTVFNIGNVTVDVVDLVNGVYTLRVSGDAVAQRFVDDNANPHEANIETIALEGVTLGCNPPLNDKYCPGKQVSRAEIAAFLLRTINQDESLPSYQGSFSDVPPGQWYTSYVEGLYQLGLTVGYGDGTYGPTDPVARSQMAAFLLRALGEYANVTAARGIFSDVPLDAWYAPYVERLYDLGITTGCRTEPLAYCPENPVKRDQMATFLSRVLALG